MLDQGLGPMMLELNVRPGLAIQVANGMFLRTRLDHFVHMGRKIEQMSCDERVAYAQDFAARKLEGV